MPDYIATLIQSIPHADEDEYIVKMKGMTLTNGFTAKLKRRGLPHHTFHSLRHSFVSILAAQGIDPKYVQEMGGWNSTTGVMETVYKQTSGGMKEQISQAVDHVFMTILQPSATNGNAETP